MTNRCTYRNERRRLIALVTVLCLSLAGVTTHVLLARWWMVAITVPTTAFIAWVTWLQYRHVNEVYEATRGELSDTDTDEGVLRVQDVAARRNMALSEVPPADGNTGIGGVHTDASRPGWLGTARTPQHPTRRK